MDGLVWGVAQGADGVRLLTTGRRVALVALCSALDVHGHLQQQRDTVN